MDVTVLMGVIQLLLAALSGVLWFNYRDEKSKREETQRELTEHKEEDVKMLANLREAVSKEIALVKEAADKGLSDFKVYVAQHHVTHTDLTKAFATLEKSVDGLFALLRRIEEKLDGKQDKAIS